MPTTSVTNLGTLLKKATVVLGEVVSIDPPELMNESIEATNHSSSGWREFIPGGLKELSEFSADVNFTNGVTVSGMLADLQAGTKASYSMTFPNTAVWTFDAYVTKFKPNTADAQSPEVLKATVTLRPTGATTLA